MYAVALTRKQNKGNLNKKKEQKKNRNEKQFKYRKVLCEQFSSFICLENCC